MIALLCFVLAVLAAPFKSKSRLEAENAALRRQFDCSAAQDAGQGPADEQRPLVSYPAVSMVSVDPAGPHNRSTRDARTLASGRFSLLLALEIAPTGRAAPG